MAADDVITNCEIKVVLPFCKKQLVVGVFVNARMCCEWVLNLPYKIRQARMIELC